MADRFAQNRDRLAASIGEGTLVVVPAAGETVRNDDVTHSFRQDSSFFFLTGFDEPEAVAVIAPGHPESEFTLFVRPHDREMEVWNGYRAGVEGAKSAYGADAAFEIGDFSKELRKLAIGRERLYYGLGGSHDDAVLGLLRTMRAYHTGYGVTVPLDVSDPGPVLADLRLRKTHEEQEAFRAACALSADGHMEAMRVAQPGLHEYQVQAAMEAVFGWGGSARVGYPSIVASGRNACVLHYVENRRRMEEGDLLLIDAAAEYGFLSADITRTFPVGGRFTSPQRALYEVVLAAQRAALATCKPGATIRDPHDAATRVLAEGVVELGLVPRGLEDTLAMHHYKEYFMHGTSHWLGMDVHDAGTYRVGREHRVLEPGMAFTVEPGLYVGVEGDDVEFALLEYDADEWRERRVLIGLEAAKREEEQEKEKAEKVRHRIPAELRGIGVRIEDDVLVTEGGIDNLSAAVPTDPDEVEAVVAKAPPVVARLIAGAILLVAACGGPGSAPVAPTATTGPTRPTSTVTTGTTLPTPTSIAIAGAPDSATLSEMVAGLCETSAELTVGRAVAARSIFYARSHDTIHLLMEAVRLAEPDLAAGLEEAKNALEVRFGYLFQDDDVGAEMDGLVAALAPVLALVGAPVIDC